MFQSTANPKKWISDTWLWLRSRNLISKVMPNWSSLYSILCITQFVTELFFSCTTKIEMSTLIVDAFYQSTLPLRTIATCITFYISIFWSWSLPDKKWSHLLNLKISWMVQHSYLEKKCRIRNRPFKKAENLAIVPLGRSVTNVHV